MKKVLLMVIGLAFMATAANATGPIAQIGLYGDAGHSVMEFMGAAGFDLYVFINPSDNGCSAAEYLLSVEGTATVLAQGVTRNDICTAHMDDPFGGIGVSVSMNCQYDWFWTFHHELYLLPGDPDFMVVGIRPGFDMMSTADCHPSAPTLEELFAINKFGLNQLGEVDNETSTWGAIKSLINE